MPNALQNTAPTSSRGIEIAYLLWIPSFFGFAGLHRLYMGRVLSGLLWLFTGGLCGIGTLVDCFMMPRMIRDANRNAGW